MGDSVKEMIKNILENDLELLKSAYWAKRYRRNCRWSQTVKTLPACFFYWQGYALFAFLCVCAHYIPFFWIPFSILSVYFFGMCGVVIYINLPRNPHSLVANDYDITYKDGTKRRMTIWVPRYAAEGYYGKQKNTLYYWEREVFFLNNKIKKCYRHYPTYYLGNL